MTKANNKYVTKYLLKLFYVNFTQFNQGLLIKRNDFS